MHVQEWEELLAAKSQVVCMLANLGKELNFIIPTSCSMNPANPFSVQTLGEDGSLENAMAFLCHGS